MKPYYINVQIKIHADSESDATSWIHEVLENKAEFEITSLETADIDKDFDDCQDENE